MNTSHFPSLELCKKLTEFDFPKTEESIELDFTSSPRFLKMPSVMELLDEMPPYIYQWDFEEWDTFDFSIFKMENKRYMCRYQFDDEYYLEEFYQETLPNALAEMWLWLKENNYLP